MVSWDKISIPLEIEVSSWGTFTATELLYKQESSDLLIKENISGSNKSASAILMVENISAADLSLVKTKDDSSGSQGGMNARLVLETNVKVYPEDSLKSLLSESKEEIAAEELRGCIVTMSTSVCNLLFLECLSPKKCKSPEVLPSWVLDIPQWLQSKRVRTLIQIAIIIYSLFSVVWAGWQLYDSVDVIHAALEPIVTALKVYFSPIMVALNTVLAFFTMWWVTFLSPLKVIYIHFLWPFKFLFIPLLRLATIFLKIATLLKSKIATLVDILLKMLNPVRNIFSLMAHPLKTVLTTLADNYQRMLNPVQHILGIMARPVKTVCTALADNYSRILNPVRHMLGIMARPLDTILDIVCGILKAPFKWAETFLKSPLAAAFNVVSENLGNFLGGLSNLYNSIQTCISDIWHHIWHDKQNNNEN